LVLPLLVECDTGAGRNGVQTPAEAVALAQLIDRLPGLEFRGLMTYPPKLKAEQAAAFFDETIALCRRSGLPVTVVSSGGTPDMWQAGQGGGVTEYRAGTYIYNDRMIVASGAATVEDCALTVLSTVVSRPTDDRAIIDAGSKTLAADLMGPEAGHGLLTAYPQANIQRLNEEHGTVDLSRCNARPSIGELVRVVPNHACVVSNLFDRVHGVRGDVVVSIWDVAARGRVA
jgi:D-serine deaminase-like pyridoxal phosphate-dependent protein